MAQTRVNTTRSFSAASVRMHCVLIWAALVCCAASHAHANPERLCTAATTLASAETGVPLSVLSKTPLMGTPQDLRPWPWSVHIEGNSIWFDTPAQAQRYVFEAFRTGIRNFDIGCFQVSYRAYSQDFAAIEDIFDPQINARHAARTLKTLYTALGDWDKAVGVYQSRTAQFARTLQKGPRKPPEQRLLAEHLAPVQPGPSLFQRAPSQQTNARVSPFDRGGARSLFTSEDGA